MGHSDIAQNRTPKPDAVKRVLILACILQLIEHDALQRAWILVVSLVPVPVQPGYRVDKRS